MIRIPRVVAWPALSLSCMLPMASITAQAPELVPITQAGRTVMTVYHHTGTGSALAGSTPTPHGLQNGDFATALEGWQVEEFGGGANPGRVFVASERAVFEERESFLVTLSQRFVLPAFATELCFDLELVPGFDRSASFVPDAFEVHLLDEASRSVVPSWDSLATSCFNIQEDGSALLGSATTFDGLTARVDLRGVAAGITVRLVVDLIGADGDFASSLSVDDFCVLTECNSTADSSNYGAGWPGALGVPSLALDASPLLGTTPSLLVGNSSGVLACACLILSDGAADLPSPFGGAFLVDIGSPATATIQFDVPADGIALPLRLPADLGICGAAVFTQVFQLDAAASAGISFTKGLAISIGS